MEDKVDKDLGCCSNCMSLDICNDKEGVRLTCIEHNFKEVNLDDYCKDWEFANHKEYKRMEAKERYILNEINEIFSIEDNVNKSIQLMTVKLKELDVFYKNLQDISFDYIDFSRNCLYKKLEENMQSLIFLSLFKDFARIKPKEIT